MTDTIKNMKQCIIDAKPIPKGFNPFYWYSQLDYSTETSHPEHIILEDKVKADLKIINEAKDLILDYQKLGIDLSMHKQ